MHHQNYLKMAEAPVLFQILWTEGVTITTVVLSFSFPKEKKHCATRCYEVQTKEKVQTISLIFEYLYRRSHTYASTNQLAFVGIMSA